MTATSRAVRRWYLLLAATVLTVLFVVGGGARVSHAAAEGDALLVSHDGVTFTPDVTLGVFGDLDRVVPGDRLVERVWGRNQAAESGRLRIDLTDVVSSDEALARAVVLSVAVPGTTPAASTPLADGTLADVDCVVLNAGRILAPGETIEVTITLDVLASLGDAPDDGRAGTQQTLAFDLRAVLTDATVPAPADDECAFVPTPPAPSTPTPTTPDATSSLPPGGGDTTDGSLVSTGGESLGDAFLATAALLLLGSIVVVATLRHRRPERRGER